MLGWPGNNQAIIKKLALNSVPKVQRVSLLGADAPLDFEQTGEGLKINLPQNRPGNIAYVFKINGAIA